MVNRNFEFEFAFGQNVRHWREIRGLSLRQLAEKMTEHGRTQSAGRLSTIERGIARSMVGGRDIEAICAVLDVPPAVLFLPEPMARVILAWVKEGRGAALIEMTRQVAGQLGDKDE